MIMSAHAFPGVGAFVQIVVFTDNMVSYPLSVSINLPAPPICDVLPSVIAVQAGMRLEQNVLFRNCRSKGNVTVAFECGGCAAERLRLTVVCL